jgi:hypothetical protein
MIFVGIQEIDRYDRVNLEGKSGTPSRASYRVSASP